MMEILHGLVHRQGIAVMMVIHDLNLASRYSDSIFMLSDGVEANIHRHDGILSGIPVRRVTASSLKREAL